MSDAAMRTGSPGLKGEVTTIEPDRFERQLVRRSAESRATVPAFELTQGIDADALNRLVAELEHGLAARVVAAVAAALRAVPQLNSSYRDARFELYSRINIGITLARPGPPVTPTIFDADAKPVDEIAREIAEFTARAQQTELHSSELAGATFTVLDASGYDIVAAAPLIQPPQAAALCFGPLREAPVVRGGELMAGHTLTLVLAVDHRIVDVDQAASFLGEIKAHLEEVR
jgi:pyruvate dehydrogenase E2 component (dihydrolipoamide acetyltransferase)